MTSQLEPEGIPPHLSKELLMHGVLSDEFGMNIEDGEDSKGTGFQYHTGKFWEYMYAMIEFNGEDTEPMYISSGSRSQTLDQW
jgi:hypothetical protein